MAVSFHSKGNTDRLERFLNFITKGSVWRELNAQAQIGTSALASSTPIDTGYTADSWHHQVVNEGGNWSIVWYNGNVNKGVNIAIILHFGYATGTGGYVSGRHYITPAISPIFEDISEKVWRAITRA